MKNICLFIFMFITVNFLCLEAKTATVNIKNDTPYIVLIGTTTFDSGIIAKLKSGETTNVVLEVDTSQAQHFVHFYPTYDIPLGNNIFVRSFENKAQTVVLSDGGETVLIKNPTELNHNTYYIVIINNSNNAIEVHQNSTVKVMFGRIGQTYIARGKQGVFEYDERKPFNGSYIRDDFREVMFPNNNYEKGYVYYYIYDGREIALESKQYLSELSLDGEEIYEETLVLYNEALSQKKTRDKISKLNDADRVIDNALEKYPDNWKYRKLKENIELKMFEFNRRATPKGGPAWIAYSYNVFDKDKYIASVGEGSSEYEASNIAMSKLYDIVGINFQVESNRKIPKYLEIMEKEFLKNYSSNSLGLLRGSITETYYNKKEKKYYAVATIDKQSRSITLENEVNANNKEIAKFLKQADREKDLFKKLHNLNCAYIISKDNMILAEELNILYPESSILKKIENTRDIQSKIDTITETINFSINLKEDNGQISMAITDVLDGLNIEVVDNGMYTVKDKLAYEGADNGYGMYIISYTYSLDLLDTKSNKRLGSLYVLRNKSGGTDEQNSIKNIRVKLENIITDSLEENIINYLTSISK